MLKSDIRGYAAIDCEMVETVGCENALARVSIGKFFVFVFENSSFFGNLPFFESLTFFGYLSPYGVLKAKRVQNLCLFKNFDFWKF